MRQAETQRQAADSTVAARLPETYQWVLVLEQKTPGSPITWQALRLTASKALAVRAGEKLRTEELLLSSWGPTMLCSSLDQVHWRNGDHVEIRQLVDDFAPAHSPRYARRRFAAGALRAPAGPDLYLQRLVGPEVLLQTIRDGVALLTWQSETFAYADGYDEAANRYRGLGAGEMVTLSVESGGMLVRSDVARRQLDAETARDGSGATVGATVYGSVGASSASEVREGAAEPPPPPARPRRFHGTVALDPTRAGRDASRIADLGLAHLVAQLGAEVTVNLEIDATLAEGANEQLVRTVTENSRTLGFKTFEFEKE